MTFLAFVLQWTFSKNPLISLNQNQKMCAVVFNWHATHAANLMALILCMLSHSFIESIIKDF